MRPPGVCPQRSDESEIRPPWYLRKVQGMCHSSLPPQQARPIPSPMPARGVLLLEPTNSAVGVFRKRSAFLTEMEPSRFFPTKRFSSRQYIIALDGGPVAHQTGPAELSDHGKAGCRRAPLTLPLAVVDGFAIVIAAVRAQAEPRPWADFFRWKPAITTDARVKKSTQ